jgi:SSS family solute:Na+ symporter
MLIGFVALYVVVTVGIGLYAATRVRGASDFAIAGKRFGSAIVATTVFATWFGAETVLGIGATFLNEGLRGLAADPFGAVACLVLVGLVFARPLYRLDVLTLGDYFRARFGRTTEIALSLTIAFSYFGWVAAQFVALGLAMNVISHGAIDTRTGIVIGAAVVLAYTMAGGMWSVALTDFFQALVIIAGMLYVAWAVAGLAGGADRVWESASAGGRMRLLPDPDAKSILGWIGAALVVMLGSVPQQDVLQRIKSAKDEGTAVRATIAGGIVYLFIALIPMFLVSAAVLIDPPMVERLIKEDYQLILPTLMLERTPLVVQALFFGALLCAILSTAGGALLAPAVTLAGNVIRPLVKPKDDRALLLTMRLTVLALGVGITVMALTSKLSIYQLVNESGKVVLVSAFVPLAAGLFWRRANANGAHLSIAAGLVTWIAFEAILPDGLFPPALAGFLAGILGMAAGSLAPFRRSVAA